MAVANVQETVLNDYEYMNENSIDDELKCSYCIQPFQVPVSAACGHTFCQKCIRKWIAREATCPTCRTRTSTEDFRPISTRIVLNQLDRLLLRCKRCNEDNIQRGNIRDHEQQCPKQTVSCPAFDIKCTWKGTRNGLETHIAECPFRKIRPAIDDIYEHLKNIYEPLVEELQTVRQQLEKQMQHNNEQNRFLLAVFNRGKPMSDRCSDQARNCELQQTIQRNARNQMMQRREQQNLEQMQQPTKERLMKQMFTNSLEFNHTRIFDRSQNQNESDISTNIHLSCANCQNDLGSNNVALHHCEGGCICRICVETYGNLHPY